MASAICFSETARPCWYFKSVASAAAPQLVSHCCTTTFFCRISNSERTGVASCAPAADAKQSSPKKHSACLLVRRQATITILLVLTTVLPREPGRVAERRNNRIDVRGDRNLNRVAVDGIGQDADRDILHGDVAHRNVDKPIGDLDLACSDGVGLRLVHLHRLWLGLFSKRRGTGEGESENDNSTSNALHWYLLWWVDKKPPMTRWLSPRSKC